MALIFKTTKLNDKVFKLMKIKKGFFFILAILLSIVGLGIFIYTDEPTVLKIPATTTHIDKADSRIRKSQRLKKTKDKITTGVSESSDLCHDFDKLVTQTNLVRQEKSEAVVSFAKHLQQLDLAKAEQERIIQNANVSLAEFRRLTAWHQKVDYNDLMPVKGKSIIPKGTIKTDYIKYLFSHNYAGIIAQVKAGLLTSQSIPNGKSVLTNTTLHDKSIETDVVEQLINAGLVPNFSDLVTLTKADMPLDMIEMLTSHISADIKQSWYHHYRSNTLTMLAAKNLNYELFNYWLSQGVATSAGEFDYTAMDMLTTPTNADELTQATAIFAALASRAVKPYDVNTLERIKMWLPVDTQQAFAYYFENHETELSDFEIGKSNELAEYLAAKDDELAYTKGLMSKCSKNNLGTTPGTTKVVDNDPVPTAREQNDQSKVQGFQAVDEVSQKFSLSLLAAKDNGRWDDFLADTDELVQQSGNDDMLTMALIQAIQRNAPFDVIKTLLQRGAVLPPGSAFILAMNNNLKLMKKLVSFGLDLHVQDKQNRNALYYTLAYSPSITMFDYLLDNGVAVTPGIDLLNLLLAKKQTADVAYYCEKLLANGHKITATHWQTFEKQGTNNGADIRQCLESK